MLWTVIADFPMKAPAHRSAWLSAPLTILARHAINGPVPLYAFEADTRGAGKTLGVDSVGIIGTGRKMARMNNPDDDSEMRKRITALAIEGERVVLLDNVNNTLGGAALDAALTGTTWKDRLLGLNRSTADLPLTTIWFASGNNLEFNGDTTRRCVRVRLESPEERPEERTGFQHPDLLAWVEQERPRLVAAALTVLRAYCAAGRPAMGLKPWGS